jgi:hypothetical protein
LNQNHKWERWQRDITIKITNVDDEKEKHDKNQ